MRRIESKNLCYTQTMPFIVLVSLGAWGCGVFGNDPQMVAEAFKKWLDTEFANNFDRVVFAVYDRTKIKNVNRAFKDTFHNK